MAETPAKKTAKKAEPKPEVAVEETATEAVEATETPVEAPKVQAPKAKPKVAEAPVLRRSMEFGDRSDAIKWAQEKLASLGYEVGEIDGRFTTLFAKALRPVQAANGLRVRAILTPDLYEILKKM